MNECITEVSPRRVRLSLLIKKLYWDTSSDQKAITISKLRHSELKQNSRHLELEQIHAVKSQNNLIVQIIGKFQKFFRKDQHLIFLTRLDDIVYIK